MSNDNRVGTRIHMFSNTGHQPWRWVGVHPSKRPTVPGLINFDKLPSGSFVYVGMLRKNNGEFTGEAGIAFYGPPRNLNGWLASVLANDCDTVREIIIKKVMLHNRDEEVKPGRTPGISLTQDTWIHLIIAPMKKGEVPQPEQANVMKNGRYYRIVELAGFDLVNPNDENRCELVDYTNPQADVIREWLTKSYDARSKRVGEARKALLEAEREADDDASDNPI